MQACGWVLMCIGVILIGVQIANPMYMWAKRHLAGGMYK
jgi:hypothetical protein